jgi:hypothetical protein
MNKHLLILGFVGLLLAVEAAAQEVASDRCDVPVVVADFNNEPVRNLTPEDFSVRLAGTPAPIASASLDAGPKRIALVLDASTNIPEEEWRLETEMAAELIKHARANDQFALLVIDGKPTTGAFSSSADVVSRLQGLQSARPKGEDDERIYDALLDAANDLDPPQFGDTVFLFGHIKDSGSKTSLDQIQGLLLKNRLRFFGISFADRLAGLPPGFNLNKPLPKEFRSMPLETLSADTGYFLSFHSIQNLGVRGQMPLFENFLSDLYKWIAEPYRLRFSSSSFESGSSLEVSVTEMKACKINSRGVHYPHRVYSCAKQMPKAPEAE